MKAAVRDDESLTLSGFFPRFLDAPRTHPLAAKTRKEYGKLFRKFIGPILGAVAPGAISRADVISFVQRLQARGETVSQIEHAYRLLRAVLGYAVDIELIPQNPAARMRGRVPRKEPSPGRALTYEELVALAREVPAWCRSMVWLMGLCGLRIGEVVALKVASVDVETGTLTVDAAFSDGEEGPTKTRRTRVVPIPGRVLDEVGPLLHGKLPQAHIFTMPDGRPPRPDYWRRSVFRPAVKRAGLERVTPHDLRRTARSLAEIEGASPEEARAMGGWSSHDMSVHYLRVYADRLRAVAVRFDEGLRKAERSPLDQAPAETKPRAE